MLVKENDGGVRILKLSNPPANMLSLGLLETLSREIAQAGADASVKCLVLSSSYPRYFSAGLDLEEMATLAPERRAEFFAGILKIFCALRDMPKPTLAAVSGTAVLGGWILAMACDWRLMSDAPGKVALSEIRVGLSPSPMLIDRLRRISRDPGAVKEMVLRGRSLRVSEALAAGLIDRVVSAEHFAEEYLAEARNLCKLPPAAYAAVKRALWRRAPGDVDALWRESLDEFNALFSGAEAQEGVAAFREKRKPRWEK
jgi:enoyl-CoA hydratase